MHRRVGATLVAARTGFAALLFGFAGPAALAEEAAETAATGTYQLARTAAKAQVKATGKLRISVRLQISGDLPNGTVLTLFPSATLLDPSYFNSSSQAGTATVANRRANATFEIPYTWLASSRDRKVTVNVSVFGSATTPKIRYSNSTSLGSTFKLPAEGTTKEVKLVGAI